MMIFRSKYRIFKESHICEYRNMKNKIFKIRTRNTRIFSSLLFSRVSHEIWEILIEETSMACKFFFFVKKKWKILNILLQFVLIYWQTLQLSDRQLQFNWQTLNTENSGGHIFLNMEPWKIKFSLTDSIITERNYENRKKNNNLFSKNET